MRIAILSDVHGNCVALESVLADLRQHPAEQLVCLGDAIQGGPQPAEVVSRLRELACPVVMGNADAWLLTGEETGHEQIPPERLRKMNAVREWALAQLSAEDRAFIARFWPTVTLALDAGRNLLCFHGSPTSYDDVILPNTPEEEFQRLLGAFASHVLTGGHTHLQQVRQIGDSFFFNPGSVGFAYRHQQPDDSFRADPWAEYAVLTIADARVGLEFRRVPFDVAELIRVYRESGRPHGDEAVTQYMR
ncbi:MAG: metallophosphoesterase family protein [Anaerolineales bacterium]